MVVNLNEVFVESRLKALEKYCSDLNKILQEQQELINNLALVVFKDDPKAQKEILKLQGKNNGT